MLVSPAQHSVPGMQTHNIINTVAHYTTTYIKTYIHNISIRELFNLVWRFDLREVKNKKTRNRPNLANLANYFFYHQGPNTTQCWSRPKHLVHSSCPPTTLLTHLSHLSSGTFMDSHTILTLGPTSIPVDAISWTPVVALTARHSLNPTTQHHSSRNTSTRQCKNIRSTTLHLDHQLSVTGATHPCMTT